MSNRMHFYQCAGINPETKRPFVKVFKHQRDMLVFALTTECQVSMYRVNLDFENASVKSELLLMDDVLETIPD